MPETERSLTETFEAFIEATTSLSTQRDLNSLLATVVSSARVLTHAEGGRIYILDPTKRNLHLEVVQNDVIGRMGEQVQQFNLPLTVGNRRNTSNICIH